MPHGVADKDGCETSPHATAVTMRAGNLASDSAEVDLLGDAGRVQLILATVYVHAALADVEQGLFVVASSTFRKVWFP